MGKKLSYNELSIISGFTYRTVKKRLYAGGIVPVGKKGNAILFDSEKALACLHGTPIVRDGTDDDQEYARLLIKEKYRQKKRQNDIEEQKYAPVPLLIEALEKSGRVIIPILETLPSIVKRNWPEITDDQMNFVKQEVAECIKVIADMKLDLDE